MSDTELTFGSACSENPHSDRHCWHWRGDPPSPQTMTQADCCWCGAYRAFGFDAVLDGRAPRSVSPTGSVHGSAHQKFSQEPTTYALGRFSPKTAGREHAQKMADHAANLGTVDLEALSARLHDIYQKEAHRRGDVRHHDDYAALPEATKEWDRVLARWILEWWTPKFSGGAPDELPPA